MSSTEDTIAKTIKEIESLKKNLSKKKSRQVQAVNEKALLKATSQSWFNNHRKVISFIGGDLLKNIDDKYHYLLESGDKNSSRPLILSTLSEIRMQIIGLRKNLIEISLSQISPKTEDAPPDFSPIISDVHMRQILTKRWEECAICIKHDAHLAATVMIGGLIESLLIMRVNQEKNQSLIYKAKAVPIDKTSLKPKPISEWKLTNLIELAFELNWITRSTKDIGNVLREYRNYIHPHKELADKVSLSHDDAIMFWEIAKNITRQLTGTI